MCRTICNFICLFCSTAIMEVYKERKVYIMVCQQMRKNFLWDYDNVYSWICTQHWSLTKGIQKYPLDVTLALLFPRAELVKNYIFTNIHFIRFIITRRTKFTSRKIKNKILIIHFSKILLNYKWTNRAISNILKCS